MKSKNLVSLSVAAVFAVLSATGLLIYLGQGGHAVDHIHAWFGILFLAAAVLHILNNWSSLKSYSLNRKAGGIRREVVLPVVLAGVFAVGIATDLPVFKDLANAGKRAFGRKKPREPELTQAGADSIARRLTTDYALALQHGDTALLARTVSGQALVNGQAGTALLQALKPAGPAALSAIEVQQAAALNPQLIVATGTASLGAAPVRFTHVLHRTDRQWRTAALQLAPAP